MIDKSKIETAIGMIIEAIGEDPNRDGLRETPGRIARMYEEIFAGLNAEDDNLLTPDKVLSKTFSSDYNNIVLEKDITFYSMCEHHFMPFFGKAHVAYIPKKKVVGISKLARTVEYYAKKPQIQERMTEQIAQSIYDNLDAAGVMVMVEAEHLCMTMRGVKKPGSRTVTIVALGAFDEDKSLQDRFFNML